MKRVFPVLLVVLVLVFAAGLWQLFQWRFEAGDVYPEYSTLRADPLGAKALYEGLGRLVVVRRDFRPHLEPGEGRGATLFLLGIPNVEELYPAEELKEVENFAAAGGRVVISFLPRFAEPVFHWGARANTSKETNNVPAKTGRKPTRPPRERRPGGGDESANRLLMVSMGERWKFQVKRSAAEQAREDVEKPVTAARKAEPSLPESLPWHTWVWFDQPDPAWRVIYARENDRAVVMERKMGAGSIVVLSDSFYFSNEAMRWHRQAPLLAWLVGPNREAIFDESHLGVQEEPGVATLARKYRLHGLLVALLALAGLFVWKNSVSFLPPPEDDLTGAGGDAVLGKESAAGLVNLLRRNIPATELLGVCFDEWKKSCARTVPAAKLHEVEAIMETEKAQPARRRDALEAYRKCSQTLARGQGRARCKS